MSDALINQTNQLVEILQRSLTVSNNSTFKTIFEDIEASVLGSGVIFFFGNGGSAAEATHLAAEFTGKCVIPHEPWPAIALNDSISSLTGIGNDFGFESIFSRQIKALARNPMVAIGLSTSGYSQNVLSGLSTAKTLGARTYLMTSQRFRHNFDYIDGVLIAATESTPRAQEVHLFWGHQLAEQLESKLCQSDS